MIFCAVCIIYIDRHYKSIVLSVPEMHALVASPFLGTQRKVHNSAPCGMAERFNFQIIAEVTPLKRTLGLM